MAKKKTATKRCKCLQGMNKELEPMGVELETGFTIDFDTGVTGITGPYLKVVRLDPKSRKKLPSVVCAYCPCCGKKLD